MPKEKPLIRKKRFWGYLIAGLSIAGKIALKIAFPEASEYIEAIPVPGVDIDPVTASAIGGLGLAVYGHVHISVRDKKAKKQSSDRMKN
jgi:hypothetical protein